MERHVNVQLADDCVNTAEALDLSYETGAQPGTVAGN
jgi:hypothetical protein